VKITCFEDLREIAKRKKTAVAVVEASDENTLKSVIDAQRDGLMSPILIGNSSRIEKLLTGLGADTKRYDIIEAENTAASLARAVSLIHEGRATALMKGTLESTDFLKAVVCKENGLFSDEKILSLAGLFQMPGYHKILAVSDIAFNMHPDLEGKKAITQNAVNMLNLLGIANPKVAVLAAVSQVNPKMPETVHAAALKEMNQNGEIANCVIEGPISFDLATSAEAARIKGFHSPVAGDSDLLIVPDIAAGNILAKCMTGLAGARTAGTILGAKIPIILTSRSSEPEDKYYSIALAACVAD